MYSGRAKVLFVQMPSHQPARSRDAKDAKSMSDSSQILTLIAYSSVSYAAVYLLGVLSNTVQGIEGGITLGLAYGFVSSGLFIYAGGVSVTSLCIRGRCARA